MTRLLTIPLRSRWLGWVVGAALLAGPACHAGPGIFIKPNYVNTNVSLTLGWNQMTNFIVVGYNIYGWFDSESASNLVREIKCQGITNTACVFSNLPTGDTYVFAATTFSAAGAESALSSSVSFTSAPPWMASVTLAVSNAPANSLWLLQSSADFKSWSGSWPAMTNGAQIVLNNTWADNYFRLTTNWP